MPMYTKLHYLYENLDMFNAIDYFPRKVSLFNVPDANEHSGSKTATNAVTFNWVTF